MQVIKISEKEKENNQVSIFITKQYQFDINENLKLNASVQYIFYKNTNGKSLKMEYPEIMEYSINYYDLVLQRNVAGYEEFISIHKKCGISFIDIIEDELEKISVTNNWNEVFAEFGISTNDTIIEFPFQPIEH